MIAHPYSRPLLTTVLIENFLKIALGDENYKDSTFVNSIESCEFALQSYNASSSTLNSEERRHLNYRTEEQRWNLRSQIVSELFNMPEPENEEDITLGVGGALPIGGVKAERKAFILIGLPASGKSGIATQIAKAFGAVILDSDIAKRKLPEYKSNGAGATLVHDESDGIIWGMDSRPEFEPLFKLCVNKNMNIVIPKIGHSKSSVEKIAKLFNEKYSYEIHLTLVSLDRREATRRAVQRFKEKRRYVPLSLVFDGYSNDPILTYYRVKENRGDLFTSFGKISTDVKKGEKYQVILAENGNPANLFK